MDYVVPEFNKDAFNCPNCKAYSSQLWQHYSYNSSLLGAKLKMTERTIRISARGGDGANINKTELSIAYCQRCEKHSIWINELIVSPLVSSTPFPTKDMPEDVLMNYNEARDVFEKSVRASAALLRLALQKLCKHLGAKGNNINDDIQFLVENGLPVKIQKALDIVRVVGNNAVHPGVLDIDDNVNVAISLFKMINIIVDTMISQPLEIEEVYDILPIGAKTQIERRDSSKV